MTDTIPIARPGTGLEEAEQVAKVLQSGMLAQGKLVREFEEKFAAYAGAKHAIAVANGTCALHIATMASGISSGDEVVTVSFSFMATANCVIYVGGVPVFVDVDKNNFNIAIDQVEAAITPRTKAILPVHLYGNPLDMDALQRIADRHGVTIIQDAAQAHGSLVRGKKLGEYGTACYSFYPTKNMTTGEGGAIITNDDSFAERCRLLREHGMARRYYHDTLGYNFRMTDIAAAIGLVQLPKLDGYNLRRRENAALLTEELAAVKGIIPPMEDRDFHHVYHQYTIRVLPEYGRTRDELAALLREKEIGSMIYYPLPIHKQKALEPYKHVVHSMENTEKVCEEVLSLPVHPSVTLAQVKEIASVIRAGSK